MNTVILANVYRFIGLSLIQGFVFQNIGNGWEDFPYLHIVVFPIFIFLLPMRIPRSLVLLLGFAIGMFVDILYDTLGLHASAAVFTAYIRPFVFKVLEPRGGYNVNLSPTVRHLGVSWYLQYTAILMLAHLFFYFSVEAFTFVYIGNILLKTIISFVTSMIFVIIYQVIFNPSE